MRLDGVHGQRAMPRCPYRSSYSQGTSVDRLQVIEPPISLIQVLRSTDECIHDLVQSTGVAAWCYAPILPCSYMHYNK